MDAGLVILTILGVAVLDSINPSALVVTFFLLTRPGFLKSVVAYASGIFVSYLALGIALLLGLDALMGAATEVTGHPVFIIIELVIGLGLLVHSFFMKPKKHGARALQRLGGRSKPVALFALGAFITVVEFSTALPYIAAAGILNASGMALAQQLVLLVIYNMIFIAPPLALAGAYMIFRGSIQQRFASWNATLQQNAAKAWPWMVGIIGFLITRDAVAQLLVYLDVIKLPG